MPSSDEYTPQGWADACLVDTGIGDERSKFRYRLPIRTPDGQLDEALARRAAERLDGTSLVGPARQLLEIMRTELRVAPPTELIKLAEVPLTSAQRIADRENAKTAWKQQS